MCSTVLYCINNGHCFSFQLITQSRKKGFDVKIMGVYLFDTYFYKYIKKQYCNTSKNHFLTDCR